MAYEFQNKTWVHGWEGMSEESQREIDEICKEEEDAEIAERARYPERFSDDSKESSMEITIKPEALDTSNLEENLDDKDDLWRPNLFKEYIGQENLKDIIQARISGCKKRNKVFPHMLIDGSAGCGKTTIAYLTSKYLDVPFIECTAGTIESPQQFVDKLALANGGIFFIDELQEIKSKVANFILPILEDFQINGKRIKKFTLFACTTEKGKLLKKYKPLVERMKIQNTLENYTANDLVRIIKQFKEKTFSKENINDDVYELIANNCRNTPRMGLRILENYIFMGKTIQEVLHAEGIIKEGLTVEDIRVLQLLSEQKNGVGVKAIASYLGTSEENYLYKHEQYLLAKKLITITSRRIITTKGKEFLKCLECVK